MSQISRIYCICGGFGFPIGTASTKRVILIGRALISAGMSYHVWHIGPSPFSENTQRSGVYQDISWEYLSPSIKRPANKWLRMIYFICGCFVLPFRLFRNRRESCVYLYYQGDAINLWVLFVCRILGIPVAQECCEWWPGTNKASRFNRWMYNHIMFRFSDGALPISTLIEMRIRKVAKEGYPILRVPVLVDSDEVYQECDQIPRTQGTDHPYIFWCGMVDGYMRDPQFLIRTLGIIKTKYAMKLNLVLAGPCSDAVRKELIQEASKAGLLQEQIIITGFIQERELFRLATHAAVTLLPLWNDDRSKSRFPTKLGLYIAAGRPIITCGIGEILNFLHDQETALFAPSNDEDTWARTISFAIKDHDLCSCLIKRMQKDILQRVDYRGIGSSLKSFFISLYENNAMKMKRNQ